MLGIDIADLLLVGLINISNQKKIKKVFLLGPSHYVHLTTCALTQCSEYKTPLGNIIIDKETILELNATGKFDVMTLSVDEEEHSIELHLPYIYKVMRGQPFVLIPILVGSVSKENQVMYGEIFSKYLDREDVLFVISSDFCHWGSRFDYTYYDKKQGPIYKSIEVLDKMGMQLIEAQDPPGFNAYLKEYKNTICGRVPISILLNTIKLAKTKFTLKFVHYAQSSQVLDTDDSSVSYAAGVLVTQN